MKLFALFALFLILSCKHDETPATKASFDVKDHWSDTVSEDKGDTKISITKNREAMRIRITQLENSVNDLFGGLDWERKVRGNMRSNFELLSLTLGRADYIRVNNDNLEPSTLFLKFVDDMASDLCNQAAEKDALSLDSGMGLENNLILRFTDIDENLKFLKLKFHGQVISTDSKSELDPYKNLYNEVMAIKKDQKTAWEAVCIMLMTEPEFYTF